MFHREQGTVADGGSEGIREPSKGIVVLETKVQKAEPEVWNAQMEQ